MPFNAEELKNIKDAVQFLIHRGFLKDVNDAKDASVKDLCREKISTPFYDRKYATFLNSSELNGLKYPEAAKSKSDFI